MGRRYVIALAAAAPFVACLFPSLGGLGDGGSDVSDVALNNDHLTIDSGDASDASDAITFIAVDDFEDGCAPYNAINATGTTSNIAHTGIHSCQVCCSGSGSFCTLDRGTNGIVTNPAIGATYVIAAWMLVAPQTNTSNLRGSTLIREYVGGSYTAAGPYSETPISQSWLQISSALTIASAGDGINVYFALNGYGAGDCFLVDDVTVQKL